jgi:hypothetical protein
MTLSLYDKKQYGNVLRGGPCLGVGVYPVLDMVVLLHAHLVPASHPRVVREQDLDLLVGRDVRSLWNIHFAFEPEKMHGNDMEEIRKSAKYSHKTLHGEALRNNV